MQLLRILGWLVDFIVGSLIWTCFLLSLPLICVGFFVYEIIWNTHRFFFFWLPLTPGLLVDMWGDSVGRFFLAVLMIIVVRWIGYALLRRMIHRKLRKLGYEGY